MSKGDANDPGRRSDDMAQPEGPSSSATGKRTYRTPALIRYGTLAEVTGNMATGSVADAMGLLMMSM